MTGISPVRAATTTQPRVWGHQLRNKHLLEAAESGDIKRTKNLIKHGADVNFTCEYGCTALLETTIQGHLEMVKLLLVNRAIVLEIYYKQLMRLEKHPYLKNHFLQHKEE